MSTDLCNTKRSLNHCWQVLLKDETALLTDFGTSIMIPVRLPRSARSYGILQDATYAKYYDDCPFVESNQGTLAFMVYNALPPPAMHRIASKPLVAASRIKTV